MEQTGIKIDTNILNDLSNNFKKDLSQIEKKIFKISGEEFNIGSTKQLGDVLYQKWLGAKRLHINCLTQKVEIIK